MSDEILRSLQVPEYHTSFDVHLEDTDDVVEVNLSVAVRAIIAAFNSTAKGRTGLVECAAPLRRIIAVLRSSDL